VLGLLLPQANLGYVYAPLRCDDPIEFPNLVSLERPLAELDMSGFLDADSAMQRRLIEHLDIEAVMTGTAFAEPAEELPWPDQNRRY